MTPTAPSTQDFPDYATLPYPAQAFCWQPGRDLRLGEDYRHQQLPLVAPNHPDCIPVQDGSALVNGRYTDHARLSVIAPIPWVAIADSAVWQGFCADLQTAGLNHRFAWEIVERRKATVHVTVVGKIDELWPEGERQARLEPLRRLAPIRLRLFAPWCSDRTNLGRLYLPAVGAGDALEAARAAIGLPPARFFAAGILNLNDHLTPPETEGFAQVLDRWAGRTVADLTLPALALGETWDNLTLDSRIAQPLPLLNGG